MTSLPRHCFFLLLVIVQLIAHAFAQDISGHLISLMHRHRKFKQSVHGKTLFMTQCFGNDFFQTYCVPLLLSWRHVYCGNVLDLEINDNFECNQDHVFVILVQGVDYEILDFVHRNQKLFGKVDMVPIPEEVSQFNEVFEGGVNIIDQKPSKLLSHAEMMFFFSQYLESGDSKKIGTFEYCVLLDSDMLFVDHLDKFLDSTEKSPWDVTFTYYDKAFKPAWAGEDDASPSLSKNEFFTRIQGAVLLFNMERMGANKVASFLRTIARTHELHMWYWADEGVMKHGIENFDLGVQEDAMFSFLCRKEFRGPFQGALAQVLSGHSEHDIHDLLGPDDCKLCNGTENVTVNSRGLDSQFSSFSVLIRGQPAHLLNQAESLPDGHFYDGLTLYHLKGAWWRGCVPNWLVCLPGATQLSEIDHFAKIEWRIDPYTYWLFLFEKVWVPFCGSFPDWCKVIERDSRDIAFD